MKTQLMIAEPLALDIISVNIWAILISLANLLILFFILKRFLYKPVKKVLSERREAIAADYSEAKNAKLLAQKDKEAWKIKMNEAQNEADNIIKKAENLAHIREEKIISEANKKAEGIVRRAENTAELELKQAEKSIKKEIANVSTALAEKLLEREVKRTDHESLIDDFLSKVGEDDGRDK
ncbi:MAG: F0F1 ATP synthase subunit B [Clostridia bacterium]|nr:F0F1 ATP synthase subunit B [Clostridia bacterium]